MKLKSIEIQGFKSFKDKIKLKFNSPICAIVGPNGSGKSNISDAIKWVLGEQSVKSLRGNKMEDVIFSGTKLEKPLNFAQVSLIFDNSDKWIPLDYNEINITRRVFRTGESEYFLNKKQCRLKDIRETFMNTGIGKEGYSIIGQGRIDEILSSKSEERRFIFEEASGISRFKYKKEESLKKLEKTMSNLIRIEDILSQKIDQRNYLAKQSEKARLGLNLSKSIKLMDIYFNKKELEIIEFETINNIEGLNNLTKELVDYDNKIKSLSSEIELIEKKNNNISIELKNKEDKYFNLNKKIHELSLEYNINEEKTKNEYREIERLKQDIEYSVSKMENLNEKILVKTKEADILNLNLEKTKLNVNNLNIERNILNNELQLKKDNLVLIKEDIIVKDKLLQEFEIQKRTRENIKKNEMEKVQLYINKLDILREELSSLGTEYNKHNLLLNDFLNDIELIQKAILIKDKSLSQLESNLEQLLINKNNLIISLKDLKREYDFYKNIIENYEGFNKQVSLFFKKIKNTTLSNIVIGTLADLIQVEEKYSKSINNVLGGNLQSIVVENENNANQLINFLKNEKIGRLTFLPLNRIYRKNNNITINDDIILAIASEIIICDEKYTKLINYFLGKTLIAKNMEYAIKASKLYNNFRIVTLDGDIINSWGSIVGGYSKNNSVNIINRNKNLDSVYFNIQKSENLISTINNDIENEVIHIEELEKDKDKMILSLEDIENSCKEKQEYVSELNSIISLKENQFSDLEFEINSYNNNEDTKIVNLDNIKDELDILNSKYSKLLNDISNIESQVKTYEYQILKINSQLESINRDSIICNNYIMEYSSEYNNININLEQSKSELSDLIKKLENRKKDNIMVKEDLSISNNKATELNSTILNLKNLKNISTKNFIEKKDIINEYKSISQKLENNINLINNKINSLNSNRNKIISFILDEYSIFIEKYTLIENPESTDKINLKNLKNQLKDLGYFSTDSIEEYETINNDTEFLLSQKKDLIKSKENIENIVKNLDSDMKKIFVKSLEDINTRFNKIFQILFDGGMASAKLNSDDILNGGIMIEAEPPGKKLQNLALLSGGERALTAVALLFAIFETSPSPFCILDEIDAALDEANIFRYTKYLKSLANNTQFIIISHRKTTMEIADSLYGVSMEEDGISKVISLEMK